MYRAYLYNASSGEIKAVGIPQQERDLIDTGEWIRISEQEYFRILKSISFYRG